MSWTLEVFPDGRSKVAQSRIECASADAARTKARKLRTRDDSVDKDIWFRILDDLGRVYQETDPSEKWRIRWYWKFETNRA